MDTSSILRFEKDELSTKCEVLENKIIAMKNENIQLKKQISSFE